MEDLIMNAIGFYLLRDSIIKGEKINKDKIYSKTIFTKQYQNER